MRNRGAWLIGGAMALVGGGLAVGVGFVFTGWLLVGPGEPSAGQWAAFLGASAVLAILGAIPGLVLGLVVSRINKRTGGNAAEHS
jgi:hypothetical protein